MPNSAYSPVAAVVRNASFFLFIVIALFVGCKSETANLPTLDLIKYNLPFKVNAPEGAEVTVKDLGIMKDITIVGNEGFSIQIYETEASSLDINKILEEVKSKVMSNDFFSKMITEEEGGFIYEKKIGEDYTSYDFRSVKIRGERQFVFQTNIIDRFSLDQAKIMFEAVR